MSKLTVTIPDDLHQKIREELERQGITTSQFIEQAVTTFFEKPKGVSNMATRTLAFQVSEELLQRIKTFLARYEQRLAITEGKCRSIISRKAMRLLFLMKILIKYSLF